MPYATALTLAVLEYTMRYNPAFSTRPVRSNTPLGNISVSYSIYSPAVGLVVADTANLTVIAELLLLQIETVATVK